jgi:hypothetical protein
MEAELPRRLGIPLGMGVILLPIVFAWFTLRRGYSASTRVAAFVWLGVNLFFAAVRLISAPY